MLLFWGVFTVYFAYAHDTLPVASCENQTNYLVPYQDGEILDPAGDGDCWTYDDHIAWHELTYNESEYSDLHLKESQYQCLESGCTNFYYGHVDLQLIEKCAAYKCRVPHSRIEATRNCSTQLVVTSQMYSDIVVLKQYYDQVIQGNRSNIEYEKHDLLHRAQTVLDESYELVNDFNLVIGEITNLLSIKSPKSEIRSFVQLREELADTDQVAHSVGEHIHTMDSTALHTKWFLEYLQAITDYGVSYSNALKLIKEYIDELRDIILHQYVYGSYTCNPLQVLFDNIAADCVLCGHGTCFFNDVRLSCACDHGWKGLTCSQPKETCADDPCIHDGACVDEFGTYRCECRSDWTGPLCEIPINQTAGCLAEEPTHPCQHNATCTEEDAGYNCDCAFGWVGKNCQYTMKDCAIQNPCDRGECKFQDNRISCECPRDAKYGQPFWQGSACSYEQLECNFDFERYHEGVAKHGEPCSGHGLCTLNREAEERLNEWTCVCDNGYFGKRCEILLDTDNACLYYGVMCVHGSCDHCAHADDCECRCDPGWSGMACSEEINECDINPCQHDAPCMDQLDDFYCDCSKIPGQYGGKYCEMQVTCAQHPCGEDEQNFCNDQSQNTMSSIQCMCSENWMGDRCEQQALTCEHDTCFNGGECMQGITAFCKCLTGWTGNRCQTPPIWCDNEPCGSAGTCSLTLDGYLCACEPGWQRQNCNIDIDECAPRPCQNGATCIDEINDFTCLCTDGWRGKRCDVMVTPCDDVSCPKHGICQDTRLENWTESRYECLCASNTCQDLKLRAPHGHGRINNHTYTLYGMIIGLAGSVMLFIAMIVWIRGREHTEDTQVVRKKRRQIDTLRMTSLI